MIIMKLLSWKSLNTFGHDFINGNWSPERISNMPVSNADYLQTLRFQTSKSVPSILSKWLRR